MAHCANTNDPEKDPDYVANSGSLAKVMAISLFSTVLGILPFVVAACVPAARVRLIKELEKSVSAERALATTFPLARPT